MNFLKRRAALTVLGAAALAIHAGSTWRSEHPLWLVENQALFDRLDWLPSSSRKIRNLYSAVYCRRFAFATTSVSGIFSLALPFSS